MNPMRVTELPALPERPTDGHKGTFGKVLLIAGSKGMSGAAALCGLGALRGGAGLVYVAVPESILPIVAGIEPSYLTVPLACTPMGQVSADCLPDVLRRCGEMSAAAIGPGLGTESGARELVGRLYETLDAPLIVDADGLSALEQLQLQNLKPLGPRILTPHPGEFSRLTGLTTQRIQKDRMALALQFAAQWRVTLLLKGAGTIVTNGSRIYVNTTGNSGMATGGTGDVLTGLITALVAQGMTPFNAAQLGAYLHGLAGDLAADELSQPGLIASDVARFLPNAWKQVLQKS